MMVFNAASFKRAVKAEGLTDKDVASMMGVTPGAVRNWMNGHSRPGKARIADLKDLGLLTKRIDIIKAIIKARAPLRRQPEPYVPADRIAELPRQTEGSGKSAAITWDLIRQGCVTPTVWPQPITHQGTHGLGSLAGSVVQDDFWKDDHVDSTP